MKSVLRKWNQFWESAPNNAEQQVDTWSNSGELTPAVRVCSPALASLAPSPAWPVAPSWERELLEKHRWDWDGHWPGAESTVPALLKQCSGIPGLAWQPVGERVAGDTLLTFYRLWHTFQILICFGETQTWVHIFIFVDLYELPPWQKKKWSEVILQFLPGNPFSPWDFWFPAWIVAFSMKSTFTLGFQSLLRILTRESRSSPGNKSTISLWSQSIYVSYLICQFCTF